LAGPLCNTREQKQKVALYYYISVAMDMVASEIDMQGREKERNGKKRRRKYKNSNMSKKVGGKRERKRE
jgi:hypothetical protein